MTEADVNGKILMIFIGEAKNTVAMCKTLMHYVAETVEVYAMRNLEEIIEMKAMLYSVNTSHHCANPAPISWAVAWQQHEQLKKRTCRKHNGR